MSNEDSPKQTEQSEVSSGKEVLDLPPVFKEEARFFRECEEIFQEEEERGLLQKGVNAFLCGSLKVTLNDIQQMTKQNMVKDDAIDQHLRHYLHRSETDMTQHAKTIAKIMLDQARQPGQSSGTQVVLLFKAIDCLRLCAQNPPSKMENIPSFLILQIMSRMPKRFSEHMKREREIFNTNMELQSSLKRGQPGISSRKKLADLYTEQKCYADALHQYEKIMDFFKSQAPSSSSNLEKICSVNIGLAAFYEAITSFDGNFKNGLILQNFILRYHRERDITHKHRKKIAQIKGAITKMTSKPLYASLTSLVFDCNLAALENFPKKKNQRRRSKLICSIANHYIGEKQYAKAAEHLKDAWACIAKERLVEETVEEKDALISLLGQCAGKITGPTAKEFRDFLNTESTRYNEKREEWEEAEKRKQQLREESDS